MPESMTKCECFTCGKNFERRTTEVNRTKKRKSNLFCSLSCTVSYKNKVCPNPNIKNLVSDNRRDEYTPFKWFLARARARQSKKGKTNLTVKYLKKIWESQNGTCPITGFKMILPKSTEGWDDVNIITRSSLDRIDNSKGYIKGNVRFVCQMANMGRQNFEDNDLIRFCLMTVANQSVTVKFTKILETEYIHYSNNQKMKPMHRTFQEGEKFIAKANSINSTYEIAAKSDQGDLAIYCIPAEMVEEIN